MSRVPVLNYTPQMLPARELTPEEDRKRVNYLNNAYGAFSWLFTVDHKRIGIMYLVTASVFFLFGGLAVSLVRLNLISPTGAILELDQYNKAFTAHGTIMLFLFLIPVIPGVLGNFLVPMMVGAKDMAFPKLNLLSYYVWVGGASFFIWQLAVGGLDTGWTLYPPYSSKYSHTNVLYAGLGIFITGFSSILTAINIIATVHKMRCPGMTFSRLPLFIWAMYATSLIQLLGTPVLAVTITLLAAEKAFGIGIFDPALEGDPLLFQHLFWFYSHPAVYIMILPGMGVVSEVLTCFSRKNIFGYRAIAWSSVGIAVVGFLVWGHHMFLSGQGYFLGMLFSLLTMLVAVPSAIKVFNWSATLYRGSISFQAPMIYALGFIVLFTTGGVTGLYLGSLGSDIHLHDTYFVIAHFHFTMVGGDADGVAGGLALLVAEDDGEDVFRLLEPAGGGGGDRRVHPDLPAAVRARLPRDAAALPELRAGVPVPQYPEYRGRVDPGDRLRDAGLLPDGEPIPGAAGGGEPVAGDGAGVADGQPAAGAQLRRDADRLLRALRVLDRGRLGRVGGEGGRSRDAARDRRGGRGDDQRASGGGGWPLTIRR